MDGDFDRAQQANIAEFGRSLEQLLAAAPGQFVLVNDGRLVETFPTKESALQYGYAHYGRRAFLVQPIVPLPDRVDDFHLTWGV